MPAQEFNLDTQHFIESSAALVDVVMTAFDAVQFGALSKLGHSQGLRDRSLCVGFGDDQQDRDAYRCCAAYGPVPRDTQK